MRCKFLDPLSCRSGSYKVKYLDRSLVWAKYRYALCLDENDYHKELKRLRINSPNPFLNSSCNATTHIFENGETFVCIVCMKVQKGITPIQIAGLLVHEAVHIFQNNCDAMGEREPSEEFEAYSIQWLSQELMESYVEQTKRKK